MKALTLFIAIFIIACTNDSSPPTDFNYPLNTGNHWEYRRTIQITNIRPDSLKEQFMMADTFYIEVTVGDLVTLKNNLSAVPIIAKTSERNDSLFSINFYQQDASGLFQVAYLPAHFVPGLPKTNRLQFRFKGRTYASLQNLSDALSGYSPDVLSMRSDSLIFYDPPRPTLSYPLFIGKRWDFANDSFRIEKYITDYGPVNLPAGDFEAFTIRWLYYFDGKDTPDEELALFEYISKKGLLKRRIQALNGILTTQTGDELGYFDYYENLELVSYDVAAK